MSLTKTDSSTTSTRPMRDNWWHLVAAMPLYLLFALLLILFTGVNPLLIQILFALAFPFGIILDARYVRAHSDTWHPNLLIYGILGVLTTLSMGVLSVIVAPYYLYRRRNALTTTRSN